MLRSFLEEFDFVRLKSDHCIFINHDTDIIIVIYVNDLLLVDSTAESLQNLKDKLENQFKMTDMSLAKHYLEIKISQQAEKISLFQSVFIVKILEHFDMMNSKSVLMSMKHETQLDLKIADEFL